MTRLTLLALACSFEARAPSLGDSLDGDYCGRAVAAEVRSEPGRCVRLDAANHDTLFRVATSEDCGGPDCIRACDGTAVLVLEKLAQPEPANWTERRGMPDEVPHCAHSALCDDPEEWCE